VKIQVELFWVVALLVLLYDTNVSENLIAPIYRFPETFGSYRDTYTALQLRRLYLRLRTASGVQGLSVEQRRKPIAAQV